MALVAAISRAVAGVAVALEVAGLATGGAAAVHVVTEHPARVAVACAALVTLAAAAAIAPVTASTATLAVAPRNDNGQQKKTRYWDALHERESPYRILGRSVMGKSLGANASSVTTTHPPLIHYSSATHPPLIRKAPPSPSLRGHLRGRRSARSSWRAVDRPRCRNVRVPRQLAPPPGLPGIAPRCARPCQGRCGGVRDRGPEPSR